MPPNARSSECLRSTEQARGVFNFHQGPPWEGDKSRVNCHCSTSALLAGSTLVWVDKCFYSSCNVGPKCQGSGFATSRRAGNYPAPTESQWDLILFRIAACCLRDPLMLLAPQRKFYFSRMHAFFRLSGRAKGAMGCNMFCAHYCFPKASGGWGPFRSPFQETMP